MNRNRWTAPLTALALAAGVAFAANAQAKAFSDLFLFGDSYTDTGASSPLTNGSTAGAYLAQDLGINLVTPKTAVPGTSGVNFAESGARVANGPTPPATHPLSLTQQVGEFQNYVQTGAVTFDPSNTLFFLLGGLNDRATPQSTIASATMQQVQTLYNLGGRYFEIALIPATIPLFTAAAVNVNPVYLALVPQLQAMFPDALIKLSNWGPDYDAVLANAASYGITNTTDQCYNLTTRHQDCTDPYSYYYYYIGHPSDHTHQIVGNALYLEALAIPEPMSMSLMGAGMVGLMLFGRRRRR